MMDAFTWSAEIAKWRETVMTKQTLNLPMDTRDLAHNSHSWNSDDNSITLTKKYAKKTVDKFFVYFLVKKLFTV